MPGLLDMFGGDQQQQGLLAAAAQMLQASGPSLRPVSFGQVLGAGLGGYQQGQQQALERAQAQQLAQLTGLKIKDAQSDLLKQEADRKRADDLRRFYMGDSPGQAVPMPAPQSANSLFQGALAGAPAQPEAAPAALGAQGGNQNSGIYQQRLAMAERLRLAGFAQEADAQEAAALKFQPKVKGWEKVQQGGRVMFAPFFEDGTSGQPVPLDVAEKLQFQNTGRETLGLNPFTGAKVTGYQNTMAPEDAARIGLDREKFNFERTQGGKPVFNADAGGFILPPSAANSNGAIIPLDGFTKPEKAPTEFQGKSAAFGLRATEADKILKQLNGKYDPLSVNRKQDLGNSWLGGGLIEAGVNKLLSPSDQQAEQAQRDFVNAILRQESGAAIGAAEFDNAKRQYFPQPSDGPGVIAQKTRNRQLAIQGLQANAGRAALTAPSAAEPNPAPGAGQFSVTAPNGKTYTFSDAKSLANFKLSAGIQ